MPRTKPEFLKRARRLLHVLPKPGTHFNLALQGGGAHGAFTWGVLDSLLQQSRVSFDGISGTSAGAINAVAMAAGYMENGAAGARIKLEAVWRAVSEAACLLPIRYKLDHDGTSCSPPAADPGDATFHLLLRTLTALLSPYEFNPLAIDPLRRILDDQIDFKGLRHAPPVKLFINATEVSSGRGRVFTGSEVTLDAVLASACLPSLHHAVKIGRQHYWDGAFSANPALLPLIEGCRAQDTLIVRLAVDRVAELPTKARDIQGNLNRIMFSQPLRKEVELIEATRRMAEAGFGLTNRMGRRLKRHRFHLIDGQRAILKLAPGSALKPDWELLVYLHQSGRKAASNWLRRHKGAIGRHSTVDLADKFL